MHSNGQLGGKKSEGVVLNASRSRIYVVCFRVHARNRKSQMHPQRRGVKRVPHATRHSNRF